MSDEIIRVLYLDDEEPNLFSFKAAFRRDFEVHTCDEPHKAVRMLDEQEFHVVLSDQRMPRISGVEFFELIMPDHPDVSRVLVTGYADTDAVVDAIAKTKSRRIGRQRDGRYGWHGVHRRAEEQFPALRELRAQRRKGRETEARDR